MACLLYTSLDQYAQNRDLFAEYYRRYRELVTVKRQLDALNASESDKQRRIEALTGSYGNRQERRNRGRNMQPV